MAVEDTDFISGLDATHPNGSDKKAEGDDHLRLLKTVLQHCFGGFGGEVILAASEAQGSTENDYVLTVTPAPTAYAENTVIIFQATHANTGAATVAVGALAVVQLVNPEGTALRANAITSGCMVMAVCDGANFRLLAANSQAIYDYVDQAQFQSALPGQASQGGKFLSTDGTDANWKAALPVYVATPTANEGPVYRQGIGVMEWQGGAYAQVYTKASIGLPNVDNTSDAAKPVSTATQTALNAKFDKSGGSVFGVVSATTLTSVGNVLAGSGAAALSTNGDISGSAWGGSLSAWLVNNKVSRGGDSMTGTLSLPQVSATRGALGGVFVNGTYAFPVGGNQGLHCAWNSEVPGSATADFVVNRGGGTGGYRFRTVDLNNTSNIGTVEFSANGTVSSSTQGTLYGTGNLNLSAFQPAGEYVGVGAGDVTTTVSNMVINWNKNNPNEVTITFIGNGSTRSLRFVAS